MVKPEILSDRELLILLNAKVDRLEIEMQDVRQLSERITKLELQVIRQEERLRIWASIAALIAATAGSIITKYIN